MSLRVTAVLSSPLCGEAPMLDGVLEYEVAVLQGLANRLRKDIPLPEESGLELPVARKTFGGCAIYRCSSPIVDTRHEGREFVTKRLAVEHAGDLHPSQRLSVAVGNSTFKSYRLPLKVTRPSEVVWFCHGHRQPIHKLLKRVTAIGRKRSVGYGRVSQWLVEEIDEDYSLFAMEPQGRPVLMRPLPLCSELPGDLLGWRQDFAGIRPPYWHPDRFAECVVPC